MGSATSAEFAASVSNQGGLGSIGSLNRTTAAIKRDIEAVKGLTNRHYAVNHIPPTLDAEAFRYTLDALPAVISFALVTRRTWFGKPTRSGRWCWFRSRRWRRPLRQRSAAPT
jgi:NAD(P)H-dependent flavin oxidoreductase YrpB (nitropropane dioxygenase family)